MNATLTKQVTDQLTAARANYEAMTMTKARLIEAGLPDDDVETFTVAIRSAANMIYRLERAARRIASVALDNKRISPAMFDAIEKSIKS